MPLRRGKKKLDRCDHGLCHKGAHPHHYFLIDLRDGKPFIRVSACTKEHLEELRIGHRNYEVRHGDQG